jgi:hypothetical protein
MPKKQIASFMFAANRLPQALAWRKDYSDEGMGEKLLTQREPIAGVETIMKANPRQALAIAAAGAILTGCYSPGQAPRWEYKVAHAPGAMVPALVEVQEKYLNDMCNEGWTFLQEDQGRFYFKRPKK